MQDFNRRTFLKQSVGAAASFAVLGSGAASPNEKIVVGVMGVGGRGTALASMFAGRKDVEIAWVADPDSRRLAPAQKMIESASGHAPQVVQDFRRILEDKQVDALINATPDHWHALGTILACEAGKHVYVEKPMCHNLREGRKMIEAARRYNRVVTVGMQTRSSPYAAAARDYVKSGKLGDVKLVRVYNMMQHNRQQLGPEQPPPPGFDYDLWCGPAAKLPYIPGRYWLNMAEFSCGPIPGDAVHQLDLARFVMGDPPPPKRISHSGGVEVLLDGRDTPDTQYATYDYEGFTLLFQGALWTPYMKKISQQIRDNDLFPEWPFCATKIEILGTKNYMYLARHGGGWQVFDADDKLIDQAYGRQGDKWHIENFLQCVRSGARPNADVEHGHYSAMLSHLANAAWRAGNRTLDFDAESESFSNSPEANRFLRRETYRSPWSLPA